MNNRQNDPQYEARKRAYYEQKRIQEEKMQRKKRYTPYYIAVVALTVLIVICIGAAIVTSVLYKNVDPVDSYTLKIDGDKSEIKTVNGKLLINLDKISKLLELQKTGNAAAPKYTAVGGDSIEFANDDIEAKITVAGTSAPCSVEMEIAAQADNSGCLVSLDTVSAVFSGITVTVDGTTVKIERKPIAGSTDKFESVSILNKSTDPISRVLYLTNIMKEYEKYLNPEDRDAYLVLVNKENPISSEYIPSDLVDLPESIKNGAINCGQMRDYAAKALEAMIKEIEADYRKDYPGQTSPILAQSGYRTYQYQSGLFNGYIEKEMEKDSTLTYEQAREKVLTYSALPDCSEHRTGLCIDLIDTRRMELENPFTNPYWTEWLEANAWKFGFILRYPESTEDKDFESITGYSYESWHFRYVGRYHAERISASGLTLEEYLDTLN